MSATAGAVARPRALAVQFVGRAHVAGDAAPRAATAWHKMAFWRVPVGPRHKLRTAVRHCLRAGGGAKAVTQSLKVAIGPELALPAHAGGLAPGDELARDDRRDRRAAPRRQPVAGSIGRGIFQRKRRPKVFSSCIRIGQRSDSTGAAGRAVTRRQCAREGVRAAAKAAKIDTIFRMRLRRTERWMYRMATQHHGKIRDVREGDTPCRGSRPQQVDTPQIRVRRAQCGACWCTSRRARLLVFLP